MKRIFIVIFAALVFFSCATYPRAGQPRKTSKYWTWLAMASTRHLEVGMTKSEVRAFMPFPTKTNRMRSASGTQEQIIWRGSSGNGWQSPTIYLYFEDDVLVSWQEN
jgi:hypothetical protein